MKYILIICLVITGCSTIELTENTLYCFHIGNNRSMCENDKITCIKNNSNPSIIQCFPKENK